MNEQINPKTVHKPPGRYSHTVKVPANAEWLAIAGQVTAYVASFAMRFDQLETNIP